MGEQHTIAMLIASKPPKPAAATAASHCDICRCFSSLHSIHPGHQEHSSSIAAIADNTDMMCMFACIPTCSCLPLPLLTTILSQKQCSCCCKRGVAMCEFPCRTYAHYCSATYNLQHNFPSMPASQLQSADEECAICKEPMKVSVATVVFVVVVIELAA